MIKLISILALLVSTNVIASMNTQNFVLEYEVFEGRGVCWQTCRDSRCEEVSYEVFWDTKTFVKLAKAGEAGMTYVFEGSKSCNDETIGFTNDHMPLLQKNDPEAAAKILRENGSQIKGVIYKRISPEVSNFIKSLLD